MRSNAATVGAFTSGTFLARLNFNNGVIDGDPVTFIKGDAPNVIIGGATGQADSFARRRLDARGARPLDRL